MEEWGYLTLFLTTDAQPFMDYLKRRFPSERAFTPYSPRSLIPPLDELCKQGWELISLTPVADGDNGDILIHGAGMGVQEGKMMRIDTSSAKYQSRCGRL